MVASIRRSLVVVMVTTAEDDAGAPCRALRSGCLCRALGMAHIISSHIKEFDNNVDVPGPVPFSPISLFITRAWERSNDLTSSSKWHRRQDAFRLPGPHQMYVLSLDRRVWFCLSVWPLTHPSVCPSVNLFLARHIENFSKRPLKFFIYWRLHCLEKYRVWMM